MQESKYKCLSDANPTLTVLWYQINVMVHAFVSIDTLDMPSFDVRTTSVCIKILNSSYSSFVKIGQVTFGSTNN